MIVGYCELYVELKAVNCLAVNGVAYHSHEMDHITFPKKHQVILLQAIVSIGFSKLKQSFLLIGFSLTFPAKTFVYIFPKKSVTSCC